MGATVDNESQAPAGFHSILQISQGYLGALWLALDQRKAVPGRLVLLRRVKLPGRSPFEALQRLACAGRDAMALSHENVLTTLEVIVHGQSLSVVYEFVEGEPLRGLVGFSHTRKRRFPASVSLRLVIDLLRGVRALHGTLHGWPSAPPYGGLSPDNVVIARDGRTRIADALIAPCLALLEGQEVSVDKLAYLAPEQLYATSPLGPAADVFTCGAMLWELLAGQPLVSGPRDAIEHRLLQHDWPDIHTLVEEKLSPRLVEVIHRSLASDPGRRPPSPEALASELENCGQGVASLAEAAHFFDDVAGARFAQRRSAARNLSRASLRAVRPSDPDPRPPADRASRDPRPDAGATGAWMMPRPGSGKRRRSEDRIRAGKARSERPGRDSRQEARRSNRPARRRASRTYRGGELAWNAAPASVPSPAPGQGGRRHPSSHPEIVRVPPQSDEPPAPRRATPPRAGTSESAPAAQRAALRAPLMPSGTRPAEERDIPLALTRKSTAGRSPTSASPSPAPERGGEKRRGSRIDTGKFPPAPVPVQRCTVVEDPVAAEAGRAPVAPAAGPPAVAPAPAAAPAAVAHAPAAVAHAPAAVAHAPAAAASEAAGHEPRARRAPKRDATSEPVAPQPLSPRPAPTAAGGRAPKAEPARAHPRREPAAWKKTLHGVAKPPPNPQQAAAAPERPKSTAGSGAVEAPWLSPAARAALPAARAALPPARAALPPALPPPVPRDSRPPAAAIAESEPAARLGEPAEVDAPRDTAISETELPPPSSASTEQPPPSLERSSRRSEGASRHPPEAVTVAPGTVEEAPGAETERPDEDGTGADALPGVSRSFAPTRSLSEPPGSAWSEDEGPTATMTADEMDALLSAPSVPPAEGWSGKPGSPAAAPRRRRATALAVALTAPVLLLAAAGAAVWLQPAWHAYAPALGARVAPGRAPMQRLWDRVQATWMKPRHRPPHEPKKMNRGRTQTPFARQPAAEADAGAPPAAAPAARARTDAGAADSGATALEAPPLRLDGDQLDDSRLAAAFALEPSGLIEPCQAERGGRRHRRPSARRSDVLLRAARKARAVGDLDEALRLACSATAASAGNVSAWHELAELALSKGDLAAARAAAESALQRRPRDRALLGLLGDVLARGGDIAKSRELLRRSLRLTGTRAEQDAKLIRSFTKGGEKLLLQLQPERALLYFRRVAVLTQASRAASEGMRDALFSLGHREAARAWNDRVEHLAPR